MLRRERKTYQLTEVSQGFLGQVDSSALSARFFHGAVRLSAGKQVFKSRMQLLAGSGQLKFPEG